MPQLVFVPASRKKKSLQVEGHGQQTASNKSQYVPSHHKSIFEPQVQRCIELGFL